MKPNHVYPTRNQQKNDEQKVQQKRKSLKDTNFLSSKTLKCPSKNNGFLYCFSCKNNVVMCVESTCQCKKNHQKCVNMKQIKPFNISLQNKLINSTIIQKNSEQIDKIINKIYQFQQSLNNELKYFGLSKQQRKLSIRLTNHFQNQKEQLKDFTQFSENQQQNKQTWINDDIKYYQQIIKQFKNSLNEGLNDILANIKIEYYKVNERLKIDSKILQNQQQCQRMVKMFVKNNQQIKKIDMIYCATKDSFTFQAFHNKCNYKPHLLYLVQNEFNKKYGAYCPCPISKQRNKRYQTDQSMKSFIFSLDASIKSNLVKKQSAINNGYKGQTQSYLVCFGQIKSFNLVISQKSNQQQQYNWIHFNGQGYQKKQYNSIEVNGHHRVDKCKLKQFQVFQITMNDQKK